MAKIKVKKVIDGDTFKDTRGRFYRLAEVNTPEKRKRGYENAKETLKKFIEGKEIIIKVEGTSYGRKIVKARMLGEKMTINTKMKRKGYK